MKIYYPLFLVTFLMTALSLSVKAQVYTEILNYSMTQVDGTARTVGAGGGLSALGADFSVIPVNPAGLGRFYFSEFNISVGFDNTSVKATYGNKDSRTSKAYLQLPSLGLVFVSRPKNTNWKTMNFAVGYNRRASYNRKFYFDGDAKGSIIEYFAENAKGLGLNELDDYTTGLAYDVGALYDDDNNQVYEHDFIGVDDAFYHGQEVREEGNMGEVSFALAGNYRDKLSLGLSVGIPVGEFRRNKTYHEEDKEDIIQYFDKLRFDETVKTNIDGVNVKLGMMLKINSILRAGFAVHSPTWLNLTDNYTNTMLYKYTDGSGTHESEKTPEEEGVFEYQARTPWRVVGSLGAILNKKGFISGDIEVVDYSSSAFDLTKDLNTSETRNLENELNRQIADNFKQAVNFRLGGEAVLDIFRLRAGFGVQASPFVDDNSTRKYYTLGVGLREDGFFVDLAFRHTAFEEGYSPVPGNFLSPNGAVLNTARNSLSITLGIKL